MEGPPSASAPPETRWRWMVQGSREPAGEPRSARPDAPDLLRQQASCRKARDAVCNTPEKNELLGERQKCYRSAVLKASFRILLENIKITPMHTQRSSIICIKSQAFARDDRVDDEMLAPAALPVYPWEEGQFNLSVKGASRRSDRIIHRGRGLGWGSMI